MKRPNQVVISRLRAGITMATHGYIIKSRRTTSAFLVMSGSQADGGPHFMGPQRNRDRETKSQHPK
jgi:hypothetical protein